MKVGLIAAMMMLSATWVVGGLASQPQLGVAVDDAISAMIYGGCSGKLPPTKCVAAGICPSTTYISFTGQGDYQHNSDTYCGLVETCYVFTRDAKKCGE